MITLKKRFSDSFNFVYNKITLVRVDLNCPLNDKKITDTTRIEKVIPTILKLLEQKAKIVLISHLGRPKGKYSDEFSLKIIVDKLEELSNKKVWFCDNDIKNLNKDFLKNKFVDFDIILLENLRFVPEEEKANDKFVNKLSSLADIYINECFSCSHRNHSSISGIPKVLPSFPGMLLEKEIQNLKKLFLTSSELNTVAVLGGSKISTKIKLIEYYAKKFSKILIGGAMANTICLALGNEIGVSIHEKRMIEFSKKMIDEFSDKIVIPEDVIVTDKKMIKSSVAKPINKINKNEMIVDIGPKTRMLFYNEIIKCEMVLWNGPLGLFERKPFDEGTCYVLRSIKENKNKNFFSVAGGGDTISILNQSNSFNDFSFVSTGGGAFLEFIQGANMPGLDSLNA